MSIFIQLLLSALIAILPKLIDWFKSGRKLRDREQQKLEAALYYMDEIKLECNHYGLYAATPETAKATVAAAGLHD